MDHVLPNKHLAKRHTRPDIDKYTPRLAICKSDHYMLFSDFGGKTTWKDTKLRPTAKFLYSKISSIPLVMKKTENGKSLLS